MTKSLVLFGSSFLLIAALSQSAVNAQSPATPPSAAPDSSAFVQGAGVDTVQARCAACHPATMVTSKHYDAQKWSEIVEQMMAKGAQVGDDEYDVIVSYLAKNYGPKA